MKWLKAGRAALLMSPCFLSADNRAQRVAFASYDLQEHTLFVKNGIVNEYMIYYNVHSIDGVTHYIPQDYLHVHSPTYFPVKDKEGYVAFFYDPDFNLMREIKSKHYQKIKVNYDPTENIYDECT